MWYKGLALLIGLFLLFTLVSYTLYVMYKYDNPIPSLSVEHLSDYDLKYIRQNNYTHLDFVQVTDKDLQNMPKLKQLIDMEKDHFNTNNNGTYDPLALNHIEVPKKEWDTYQTWFQTKFENEYGIKQATGIYFQYGGEYYFVAFVSNKP